MTNPPPNDTPLDPESQPTAHQDSPSQSPSPESQPIAPTSPDPAASAQTPAASPEGQPAPMPAPSSASPELAPTSPAQAPAATSPSHWRTLAKAAGYGEDLTPEQQITRRTFVSFSAFALLGAAAWKSWFWIKDAVQSDGVQTPLRKGLNVDGKIFKHTLSPNHLAKTYPREQAAKTVRYNSGIGLGADPATWRLQVTKANGEILAVSLDDLKALPKTDFAFEFKCIEGWSQVSWWGGVRFSDFIQHYDLTKEAQQEYVGLTTPDDHYYVGVDTPSMLHPQTILAYEMSGQPLPARHGAPLRLIIPVKYGVKNLKCVGKVFFSNDRPRDYWFERGYDYYCGL
ncbi:MAG TPA: molybdopterin-dependent oxidoreductase [Puia sp.]|nr:molybdopterin-dependent oxidoreductase [Puia sp.]